MTSLASILANLWQSNQQVQKQALLALHLLRLLVPVRVPESDGDAAELEVASSEARQVSLVQHL